MTAAAASPASRQGALQTLAVIGSAAVLLLALAGLGNMALSHAATPDSLKSGAVVAHLATVLAALPLGISQLLLPKGTFRHRVVGYVWIVLMVTTAIVSFSVHTINRTGLGLSPIHLFSVLTLISAPGIVWAARTGRVEHHRRAVLGLMLGGLVIAGIFTFIPGRALGQLVLAIFQH